MSFLVLILILTFLTLFTAVSIQIRRMTLKGEFPIGHVPRFLAKKLSEAVYAWSCMVLGWILVIFAGLIYNSGAKGPGGPFWSEIYLMVLTLIFGYLWLRNRAVELKP